MGYCDSGKPCAGAGECKGRKGAQSETLLAAIDGLYPGRHWGASPEPGDGPTRAEVAALGRALSRDLRAPVYREPGGPDDLCDYLWVLCVGRHPGLLLARAGRAEPPGERVRETYLRVNVSALGPWACVQEVRVALDRRDDAWLYQERPRDGVFDPVLLRRFQATIARLQRAGLTHLDMGMLEKSPRDCDGSAYLAAYGAEPTYLAYLFYPDPPTTVRSELLPFSEHVEVAR